MPGIPPPKLPLIKGSHDWAVQDLNLRLPACKAGTPPTPTPCGTTTDADENGGCCTAGCTNFQELLSDDPRLAAIVHTWRGLPEAVKAGIVAMVRVASE